MWLYAQNMLMYGPTHSGEVPTCCMQGLFCNWSFLPLLQVTARHP